MNCTPLATRSRPRKVAPRLRPGMTLIELMVAVSVMVIMILFFGMILNSSDQVVRVSQAQMRADRSAAAIASIIRQDMLRIAGSGILCFTSKNNLTAPNYDDRLLFIAPGVFSSLVKSDTVGTGSMTVYGIFANANPDYSGEKVLVRRGWVFVGPDNKGDWAVTIDDDTWNLDFSNIASFGNESNESRIHLYTFFREYYNGFPPPYLDYNNVYVPPTDIQQVEDTWQVLSNRCQNLQIEWFEDGTWKNARSNGTVSTQDGSFSYKLFTFLNKGVWPQAVRFRFTINDETLPEEFQNAAYEVICPIGANR